MSKEDQILAMLAQMQQEMEVMKADIKSLKAEPKADSDKLDDDGVRKQLETLNKMRNLLTDEEAEALGKYMEAEEERKNKLYA